MGKESIRRRCYELNPLSIPVDKAHEAKDILRNYDLIRVSEISVGLAAFFSWVRMMKSYVCAFICVYLDHDDD